MNWFLLSSAVEEFIEILVGSHVVCVMFESTIDQRTGRMSDILRNILLFKYIRLHTLI